MNGRTHTQHSGRGDNGCATRTHDNILHLTRTQEETDRTGPTCHPLPRSRAFPARKEGERIAYREPYRLAAVPPICFFLSFLLVSENENGIIDGPPPLQTQDSIQNILCFVQDEATVVFPIRDESGDPKTHSIKRNEATSRPRQDRCYDFVIVVGVSIIHDVGACLCRTVAIP